MEEMTATNDTTIAKNGCRMKPHLKDDEQPTFHERIGDRRHTLPIEHEDVVMLGHLSRHAHMQFVR